MIKKTEIEAFFKSLQDDICLSLEKNDRKTTFLEDKWSRPGGGGGRTRVISEGDLIEKGGVNFSAVHGETPENILNALNLDKADFFATGVSIVIHPNNPHVPIIHMNVRYFEMTNGVWWFGGGIDLTPHYIDVDEAKFFHEKLKMACDKHNPNFYSKFKEWADNYFYIKHRKESRGIGGIFFDQMNENYGSKKEIFEFVKTIGNSFAPIYNEIANKKRNLPFSNQEKDWQKIRRGRYVEFNLVLDKGTKFGLDTDGRTESILMSLPRDASWVYNYEPKSGSKEEFTLKMLGSKTDWVNFNHD